LDSNHLGRDACVNFIKTISEVYDVIDPARWIYFNKVR